MKAKVEVRICVTSHWDQINMSLVPIHGEPGAKLACSIANSIWPLVLMFVSPKTTGVTRIDRAAAELAAALMQLWMTLVRPVRLKACALQDTVGKRWSASVD